MSLMRIGIVVGHGDPLGALYLTEVRKQGFPLVRIQAYHDPAGTILCTPEECHTLVGEVIASGLQVYVTIRHARQVLDLPELPMDVGLGNEPNVARFGWHGIDEYRAETDLFIDLTATRPHLRPWIGEVKNLEPRDLDWLRQLPWRDIPSRIGCGYHWYPETGRGPEISHHKKGWFGSRQTRAWEFNQLRDLIGDRPMGVSETGFHELEFPEPIAARHFAWQRQFLESTGHDFAIAYQVEDGLQDDPGYEAHFGFRDLETGRWKAQTRAWTGRVDVDG